MHNVKIIRMQTGEDIMASMIGEEEAETVLLEDPMRLIFRRMPTGQTMLMMLPWLPVELIKDNSALIYNSDIITIIDPKESMVQYYDNLVMKTLLEMEKSEEMIEQLLRDQEEENEEAENYIEELTQYIEEIKNRTLH
jgi:NDP-sugar pyrophosphorylase family protein